MAFALGSGCCPTGGLTGGKGQLEAPATLAFGDVYQGETVVQNATLANAGTADLELDLSLTGNPQLSLSSPSLVLAEGTHEPVPVTLYAAALGPLTGTLVIAGDALGSVQITATVVPDPGCPVLGPCVANIFYPDSGTCVSTPTADGLACDGGDPCSTNTTCAQGLCKGVPLSCNDDNVCTVDYCQAGSGCQHLDETSSCDGTNPCQVYYCDPSNGCQSSNAADGTPCSAEVACVMATACLNGSCTGVPIPNGTPCVDPKDPCAKDAACANGVCDSPTADALKPGDILWQTVSSLYAFGDGGSTWISDAGYPTNLGWRAAAAVDEDGNLYLDDVQPAATDGQPSPGDFVSLDQCGNERWRVAYPSSSQWTNGRHLLTQGVVVSVADDQTISGQSQATGATLWTFDPAQLAVTDPANTANFTIEDVALSSSGVLYYSADWTYNNPSGGIQYETLLGGVLRNGQSKFQTLLTPQTYDATNDLPRRFGYPLMVDENENLYTSIDLTTQGAALVSFDQTGTPRFTIPVARLDLNGLAENHGFFVEPVSLTAFSSFGSVIWEHTESASVVTANGHSPVISGDGNITLLRDRLDLGHGVAESYGPDGSLLWQYALDPSEIGYSSHVIDNANVIYFATSTASGLNQRVVALREADGTALWAITLPTVAPVYNGVLASTPSGTLVASVSERLFGIYAGNGLSSAPWPRFRGANANDSTPATVAQPSP